MSFIFSWYQVYDVWSGQNHSVLRGHYDLVNCCTFHPQEQVLKLAVSDLFYMFSLAVNISGIVIRGMLLLYNNSNINACSTDTSKILTLAMNNFCD